MHNMRSTLLAALSLSSVTSVNAYWRMQCGTVQTGRIDPIVYPGQVSSHVHKISGGSNININSTYESMRESSCTSCEIQADKSGYWTPQLYYQHGNGQFEEVPNGGTVVYYLGRGANIANAVPFPAGFQMLSGTPLARSYDNETMTWGNKTYPPRPVSDRVSFVCIGDNETLPQETYMAFDQWPGGNKACTNGMRAQIQFPSCWNGVDLYKADGSHVDYLSQIDNGACSPEYPVQFIHLFFEVYYSVAQFDTSDGGRFVFAFGDPTGYGFHGDFLNGWDLNVLGDAIDQCAVGNVDGVISECAPLAVSDISTYAQNCPEYAPYGEPLINETVHGLIGDKLPGCITIVDGPEPATLDDMQCGPNVPTPTIEEFAAQTPIVYLQPNVSEPFGLAGWNYAGCFEEGANGTRTLNADSLTSDNMTVEICQQFCSSKGWRFAGVEWSTQCFCASEIPAGTAIGIGSGNQTACTQICAGNSTELCGGPDMLSIFNNTLSTATIAAPGAGATPAAAGVYVGCASEGANNARTLNGHSSSAPNMTLEMCRATCDSLGFYYSGTEYSDECYCGNSFVNGGGLLPSNSSCNMLCAGNGMETCGGPSRLSVFSPDTGSSATCPSGNGSVLTVGKTRFTLNCATDFPGGDISLTYAPNVYECSAACANTTGCLAASYVGTACYLKGALMPASASPNVQAVAMINTPVVHACPGDNGKNITTTNGDVFSIQCGFDHAGGDLSVAQTMSLDACAASCANTTGCVGASYVPGSPGTCYQKQKNLAANSNSNVWALVLQSAAPAPATSSSATASKTTIPASSTSSTTSATSTPTPTLTCPSANGTLTSIFNATTSLNTTFAVQCYTDHPGDASMVYTPTFSACLAACASYTNCTDVSYVAGGGNSPCYLKTQLLPASGTAAGVWGAVVVNQTLVNQTVVGNVTATVRTRSRARRGVW